MYIRTYKILCIYTYTHIHSITDLIEFSPDMIGRKVHKSAVLCMDCSVAKSLTTGSIDKWLRLFDTRGIHIY